MAAAVRRFGVLTVGIAAIVAGVLVYQFRPSAASFGWTAYAPLSNTVFVPSFADITPSLVGAALLILLGAVLIAGWVGFAAGRRRPRPSQPSRP